MDILRINMEKLEYRYEELPQDKILLGGRALTSKIIYEEVPATAHPLGPNNKLVISNGVLTGSLASSAERTSMGGKSPLTGGIKESNAGGTVGLQMGRLGLRAVILEGIRDDFKIIYINKDGIRFDSAGELLGKPLSEAARIVYDKYGHHVGFYMIGVSGEMKMLTAAITNPDKDKNPTRFYGRGGLGAVAGSKGIKAVIFDDGGVARNKPKDPDKFREGLKTYSLWLSENPGTSKVFPELGTAGLVKTTNKLGALPTRNFFTGSFEGHLAISGEALRETILDRGGEGATTHACMPGCAIRCSNIYVDQSGKMVTSPIEYENIGLLGSNLGIDDLDTVVELNRLCNEFGVDTIEVGAAMGVAMEAGIVAFGDRQGAIDLLKEVGKGSPLGRIIGSGAVNVGEIYGIRKVPAVKGQGMPAYDPRAIKGLGVTYATSTQGADHTAGQTIRAQLDHYSPTGQVQASKDAQITNMIFDMLGLCYFGASAVAGRYEMIAQMISGYVGSEITAEGIHNLAKETLKIEHSFNRNAGFTKAHDRLPEHFYTDENPASKTVFDVPEDEILTIGVEGYR
ncbi:MAG TPA: aldehyde ferredoxin oxidoreductase C-terminal domain-containing protein [Bacillota bacterium]|nr:aldehyde ferredoxin oxidoreductase C-terminal domain-containing protein [Bacillota bacterium]